MKQGHQGCLGLESNKLRDFQTRQAPNIVQCLAQLNCCNNYDSSLLPWH